MKKIAHLMLLLALAGRLAVNAQTNLAVTNLPADSTNPPPPAVMTTNGLVAVDTNAVDTNAVAAAAADATAVPAAPASIPLIQFSDVPITTAIENLARQANINYMLDPKIGYGLPDANGQIKTEPTLSIRWENISAENALVALLDNYGLQLVRDNKTGIARVCMKDPAALPRSSRG